MLLGSHRFGKKGEREKKVEKRSERNERRENCQVERRIGRSKKVCEEDEGSLPKKLFR